MKKIVLSLLVGATLAGCIADDANLYWSEYYFNLQPRAEQAEFLRKWGLDPEIFGNLPYPYPVVPDVYQTEGGTKIVSVDIKKNKVTKEQNEKMKEWILVERMNALEGMSKMADLNKAICAPETLEQCAKKHEVGLAYFSYLSNNEAADYEVVEKEYEANSKSPESNDRRMRDSYMNRLRIQVVKDLKDSMQGNQVFVEGKAYPAPDFTMIPTQGFLNSPYIEQLNEIFPSKVNKSFAYLEAERQKYKEKMAKKKKSSKRKR